MNEPFEHFLRPDFAPPREQRLSPGERWIIRELMKIKEQLVANGQGLVDLQNADVQLDQVVVQALAFISAQAQAILNAQAGDDDAAVEKAAQDIQAQVAQITAAITPPAASTSNAVKS